MAEKTDDRRRWCSTFAALLVDEAKVSMSDALFLAEQARVCRPGLPPSYALRLVMTNPRSGLMRVAAGRRWAASACAVESGEDDTVAGW